MSIVIRSVHTDAITGDVCHPTLKAQIEAVNVTLLQEVPYKTIEYLTLALRETHQLVYTPYGPAEVGFVGMAVVWTNNYSLVEFDTAPVANQKNVLQMVWLQTPMGILRLGHYRVGAGKNPDHAFEVIMKLFGTKGAVVDLLAISNMDSATTMMLGYVPADTYAEDYPPANVGTAVWINTCLYTATDYRVEDKAIDVTLRINELEQIDSPIQGHF